MHFFPKHLASQICAAALACAATVELPAAPFSIPNTDVRVLPRSANGRDYTLYVGLPSSYASSPNTRYPVIYAVDGYWDFPLLLAEIGNLRADNVIPECILVGIAYAGTSPNVGALRQLDLTPGVDRGVDPAGTASGQADQFLNVIAGEIIPYVEASFRVDSSFRGLTGSSYGGLFTLYAVFARPGLFQGFVAPSPSLWWRNGYISALETSFRASHPSLPVRVFTSFAGNEYASIRDTTRQFTRQLQAANYGGLAFASREIEGEGHSGTKGEAFNRGLRFLFAPYAGITAATPLPGFSSRSTLMALSTRGHVGGGENVLIGGIIVNGFHPKRLVIRAVGPTLANYGVAHPVPNPRFNVIDINGRTVASNDNWTDGDVPTLQAAFLQSGAAPLNAGSRDAATIVTLEPGNYTVVVESADGTDGVALVEAYELLP